MQTFKQSIIEKPDHHVTMSDGRRYALKQVGNKVRSYATGRSNPDGTPEYMHTRGGVTFVRLN